MIKFPGWVTTTKCTQRTSRKTYPNFTRHGALILQWTYPVEGK